MRLTDLYEYELAWDVIYADDGLHAVIRRTESAEPDRATDDGSDLDLFLNEFART